MTTARRRSTPALSVPRWDWPSGIVLSWCAAAFIAACGLSLVILPWAARLSPDHQTSGALWSGLDKLGLILLGIGGVVAVPTWISQRSWKGALIADFHRPSGPLGIIEGSRVPQRAVGEGWVRLRQGFWESPGGGFVIVGGMYLFLLLFTVAGLASEDNELPLKLFFIGFNLIWLSFVVILGRMYFTLQPQLWISRSEVPLGQSIQVRWRFPEIPRRFDQLEILVQGAEVAAGKGDEGSDDRSVFHTATVLSTYEPEEAARGEATIEIPADSMHSLDTGSNRIEWDVLVNMHIRRRLSWMPLQFPIRVVPHA